MNDEQLRELAEKEVEAHMQSMRGLDLTLAVFAFSILALFIGLLISIFFC